MRLKLASRKSDLARWQAIQVARYLETHSSHPSFEFLFKASLGDQDLDTPLASMGSKGVFTEDFYQDLVNGNCDLVVHSWKDLPVESRVDTAIAMTMPRADVRDIVLIPEEVWAEACRVGKLKLLSSSPRRIYNLSSALPTLLPARVDLEFVNVRGNVPTRLRKMHEQGAGLVLAKAGLDRLLAAEEEGFGESSVRALVANCRFMVLPLSLNPAAPAQGALAIEIRNEHPVLSTICSELNDSATFACAEGEREILKKYGGGCHQKIGVTILEREFGSVLSLRGVTDQGEVLSEWRINSPQKWSRAQSVDAVFPRRGEDNSWFDRHPINVKFDLTSQEALFVARAEALPENYKAEAKQIIWTAGVKSWQRLAARGLWVHGTADSLGETETIGLDYIVGPLKWAKVTHAEGLPSGMKLLATYELKPAAEAPDLTGKTHFYWMSSTSFERARKLCPEAINNGFHAAGPGSTFQHIRNVSGLKNGVKPFAGLEQFLAETLP